jgi:5-methyltetrahydrofolate--homocysteine methyltransferase
MMVKTLTDRLAEAFSE